VKPISRCSPTAPRCWRLTGASPGRFILLAGRPLKEPIVQYGPFVMNTPDEIRQAITDFHAGRF
jgi:redox-sensitive bicupin YhaK (pirin superfamily)